MHNDSERNYGSSESANFNSSNVPPSSSRRKPNPRQHYKVANLRDFVPYSPYIPRKAKTPPRRACQLHETRKLHPGQFVRMTNRLFFENQEDLMRYSKNTGLGWSLVKKVDVLFRKGNKDQYCPICLTELFIAPRITRCGHIFCYPCIVRYLNERAKASSTDQQLQSKCPVCATDIDISELKLARFTEVNIYNENDVAAFCLVQSIPEECRVTVLGIDAPQQNEKEKSDVHIDQNNEQKDTCIRNIMQYYGRLGVINAHQLYSVLLKDLLSLQTYLTTQINNINLVKDDEEIAAIEYCTQQVNQYLEMIQDSSSSSSSYKEDYELTFLIDNDNNNDEIRTSQPLPQRLIKYIKDTNLNVPVHVSLLGSYYNRLEEYYNKSIGKKYKDRFNKKRPPIYQLIDGQFGFLDDISMRCIIRQAEINSLSCLSHQHSIPTILENISITWAETKTMDSDLRRKYPELSHVPLGASFQLFEVNLTNYVSTDVIANVDPDAKRRRSQRRSEFFKKKHQEEKVARQCAQKREEALAFHRKQPDIFNVPEKSDIWAFPTLVDEECIVPIGHNKTEDTKEQHQPSSSSSSNLAYRNALQQQLQQQSNVHGISNSLYKDPFPPLIENSQNQQGQVNRIDVKLTDLSKNFPVLGETSNGDTIDSYNNITNKGCWSRTTPITVQHSTTFKKGSNAIIQTNHFGNNDYAINSEKVLKGGQRYLDVAKTRSNS